jgi:hypothetical protein
MSRNLEILASRAGRAKRNADRKQTGRARIAFENAGLATETAVRQRGCQPIPV